MNENEVKVVDELAENAAEEIACTTKPNGIGVAAIVTVIGLVIAGGVCVFKKLKAKHDTKNTTQENSAEQVEENPEENIEAEA